MTSWLRRALTKKVSYKTSRGKQQIIVVEPDERLVLGLKFAIAMVICLSALEVAHMILMNQWNSEIFAAITGLIGTISGILISQKS